MVGQAVQERHRQLLVAKDLHPLAEGQVRRHHGRAPLVTLGEHIEEQLPARAVEWHEAKLIDLCETQHKSINVEYLVMWSSPKKPYLFRPSGLSHST